MKRYPHKAQIIVNGGNLINGEWVEGNTSSHDIIGRYDPSNNDRLRMKNAHGDEVVAKAEFYTQHKPIVGAKRLVVPELDVDEAIVSWWGYQTHSVIYV